MKKNYFAIALLTVLAFCVTACGDDDDDNNNDSALIGTWSTKNNILTIIWEDDDLETYTYKVKSNTLYLDGEPWDRVK